MSTRPGAAYRLSDRMMEAEDNENVEVEEVGVVGA